MNDTNCNCPKCAQERVVHIAPPCVKIINPHIATGRVIDTAISPFDRAKIIDALKQADNAIRKAIEHFSRTAGEIK